MAIKTPTTDLYNMGLVETMCFQGLDYRNYWYMKDGHLYHCNRGNKTLHRRLLGQRRRINLHSPMIWKAVDDK